jgi:hypothetical protein
MRRGDSGITYEGYGPEGVACSSSQTHGRTRTVGRFVMSSRGLAASVRRIRGVDVSEKGTILLEKAVADEDHGLALEAGRRRERWKRHG